MEGKEGYEEGLQKKMESYKIELKKARIGGRGSGGRTHVCGTSRVDGN